MKPFSWVVGLGALAAAAPAMAQTPAVQIEQFESAAIPAGSALNVWGAEPLTPGSWTVGLTGHFSRAPLSLAENGSGIEYNVVRRRLVSELHAGVGILRWLDAGLSLPVVANQAGDPLVPFGLPGERLHGTVLGDLRVVPRAQVLRRTHGFALGASVPVYVPTGDRDTFNSDGTVRIEGRLLADWVGPADVLVCANAGYQVRPTRQFANYISDDAFRWALGARAPLGRRFAATGSVFGTIPTAGSTAPAAPAEVLGGIEIALPQNLAATLAGGAGIGDGIGTPQYRVLLTVGYVHAKPRPASSTVTATPVPTPTPALAPTPAPTPIPVATGRIVGVVRDAESGMPLRDARLQIGERDYKTDRFGRFEVAELEEGAISVAAAATGYQDARINVQVTAGSTATLTVDLQPAAHSALGTVSGDVHARNGQSLQATLIVAGADQKRTVATEATGQFEFSLKPGTYRIRVQAPGYRDKVKRIVVKAEELSVYNFVLDR